MIVRKVLYSFVYLSGVVFFGLLAIAAYQHFQKTHSILSFGIVAVNGLMLGLYLLRRQPATVIGFPFAWLIGFTGTCLPLLFRPNNLEVMPELAVVGYYLQIGGLAAVVGALLSLRTSFGIVAANRGIQKGGLYRVVRHPLYASELLYFCGFVLANVSVPNVLILIADLFTQYTRACIEENFLKGDPTYRHYMSKTRYRFVPGLL